MVDNFSNWVIICLRFLKALTCGLFFSSVGRSRAKTSEARTGQRLLPPPMSESKLLTRATIADVAEHADVSIATVSRVINKTATVAAATADRVQAAIAALNYMPHAAARGLASRKTNTLGLLLPEISGAFFSIMLRGVEKGIAENGYALLVYSTQGRARHESNFHFPLGEHNTDGLLVFTDSLDETQLARLHARHFPLVLLHQSPPPGLHIPCVTFQNKAGARQLIEHLLKVHGRRRIAFLAGPAGHEDSYWREMGYREALAAHGLPFDPTLVGHGGFSDKIAQVTVEQWLAAGADIDAIFTGDDEAALGVIAALRRFGRRIPQDVAVVGFDDLPHSRYVSPALTTVRAPIETAGQVAAQQLLHLIHTGQAERLLLLPTELLIRHSCGC
jgi:DNA-binding LacI/PurR family transcriptional regulator